MKKLSALLFALVIMMPGFNARAQEESSDVTLNFTDADLVAGRWYVALMAPTAAAVAAWIVVRSQHRQAAEREFATWYRVPPGCELVFSEGWWTVQTAQEGRSGGEAGDPSTGP